MADKREYIIIHETLAQSVLADLFTFTCLAASIYVGVLLQSTALQWIAGILMIITIIAVKPKYRWTYTSIDEAKAHLDRIR